MKSIYIYLTIFIIFLWIIISCDSHTQEEFEFTKPTGAYYDFPDDIKKSYTGFYNTELTETDSDGKFRNALYLDLNKKIIKINKSVNDIIDKTFIIIKMVSPYEFTAGSIDNKYIMKGIIEIKNVLPEIRFIYKKINEQGWKNVQGNFNGTSTKLREDLNNTGGITQLLVRMKNGGENYN